MTINLIGVQQHNKLFFNYYYYYYLYVKIATSSYLKNKVVLMNFSISNFKYDKQMNSKVFEKLCTSTKKKKKK